MAQQVEGFMGSKMRYSLIVLCFYNMLRKAKLLRMLVWGHRFSHFDILTLHLESYCLHVSVLMFVPLIHQSKVILKLNVLSSQ